MAELLKDIDGNTIGYEIDGHRYFYGDLFPVKPVEKAQPKNEVLK